MSSNTKITGELISDPDVCLFHLEEPILEEWTMVFDKPEDARNSALADHLFHVNGVARFTVTGPTIAVVKNVQTPWPILASQVGHAIRAAIASGQPLISDAALDTLRSLSPADIAPAVERLIEEKINPALAAHGGFVRLAKVEHRDVHIEMGGGCQGCAASKQTMKYGIETAIRRTAPHVRHIIDVTDHAGGENPFYS